MYQLTNSSTVIRLLDGTLIPEDPDNRDYAAYLAWLKDGGVPKPAEALPVPVVKQVTAAQGGIALIRAGLMDVVLAAVNSPETPAQVKWAFEKAQDWHIDSPAFSYLADKAGIEAASRKRLFEDAANIEV